MAVCVCVCVCACACVRMWLVLRLHRGRLLCLTHHMVFPTLCPVGSLQMCKTLAVSNSGGSDALNLLAAVRTVTGQRSSLDISTATTLLQVQHHAPFVPVRAEQCLILSVRMLELTSTLTRQQKRSVTTISHLQ
jgi:hypothetical protein